MTDRDRAISRALNTMPVPEHRAGFWDRLDAAIAEEISVSIAPPTDTDTDSPTETTARPDTVTELRPAERRRAPRRWQFVGAAAAAVAAIVVAATLVTNNDRDVRTVNPADRGNEPEVSPTPPPGSASEIAGQAVADWLQAVAAGDADRAWELMGPQSQQYLGRQQFGEMVPSMAEGSFGQWTGPVDDLKVGTSFLPAPAEGAGVTTYSGTIRPEGMEEFTSQAFPVRLVGGRWTVEPFAFGPGDTDAEFITPEPGQNGLGAIGPVGVIEIDAKLPGDAYIALDSMTPELMMPAQNVPGRWRYAPVKPLTTGTHQILVITVAPDWFTAASLTFPVEG